MAAPAPSKPAPTAAITPMLVPVIGKLATVRLGRTVFVPSTRAGVSLSARSVGPRPLSGASLPAASTCSGVPGEVLGDADVEEEVPPEEDDEVPPEEDVELPVEDDEERSAEDEDGPEEVELGGVEVEVDVVFPGVVEVVTVGGFEVVGGVVGLGTCADAPVIAMACTAGALHTSAPPTRAPRLSAARREISLCPLSSTVMSSPSEYALLLTIYVTSHQRREPPRFISPQRGHYSWHWP